MHPARARRLRPADEPEIVQRCANDVRDFAQLRPWDARHGIEVDAQLVRVIERVAASRGTTSSAVRPDGKLKATTSTHGGRESGARF
jgi:hypothetical protein